MTEILFPVFISIVVLCLAVPLIAVYLRTKIYSSAVFFICSGILLIMPLSIDNIRTGETNTAQTYNNATDTIENEYTPTLEPLRNSETLEPSFVGIAIILFAILLMTSGVLIEKYA